MRKYECMAIGEIGTIGTTPIHQMDARLIFVCECVNEFAFDACSFNLFTQAEETQFAEFDLMVCVLYFLRFQMMYGARCGVPMHIRVAYGQPKIVLIVFCLNFASHSVRYTVTSNKVKSLYDYLSSHV